MGLVPSSSDYIASRIPPRSTEHNCRLGIEAPPGQQQLAAMSLSVWYPELPVGSLFNRFVRLQNQPPVTYILQLETGSRCMLNRCILDFMGQNDSVSLSSFLFGRQSATEDSQGSSRSCLPDSTSMASAALVTTAAVDAVRFSNFAPRGPRFVTRYEPSAQSSPREGEVVPDRLAYLRQTYEAQGFSHRVTELVIEFWRGNTNHSKTHVLIRTDTNSVFYSVLPCLYSVLGPLWDHQLNYVEVCTVMDYCLTKKPSFTSG